MPSCSFAFALLALHIFSAVSPFHSSCLSLLVRCFLCFSSFVVPPRVIHACLLVFLYREVLPPVLSHVSRSGSALALSLFYHSSPLLPIFPSVLFSFFPVATLSYFSLSESSFDSAVCHDGVCNCAWRRLPCIISRICRCWRGASTCPNDLTYEVRLSAETCADTGTTWLGKEHSRGLPWWPNIQRR